MVKQRKKKNIQGPSEAYPAQATAHHLNRRNLHASHCHLASTARQLQPERGSPRTAVPADPPTVKFEGSGGKAGLSITFAHLRRKFYQITLWAVTRELPQVDRNIMRQ